MRYKKKRSKKKIIGYSILVVFLLLIGGTVFAYYQLKPENHFSKVPLVSSGDKDSSKTIEKKVKIDDPIFNVLLIGSDQRKGQKIGHSDTMMVVSVDLKNYKYHMLSIPRDSRVYLDGYGYTKLTSAQYILQNDLGAKKGIEVAVGVISDFTGIPINYYVETNYTGLEEIVDALDGINMNVPFDVKLTHSWYPENKNKVIAAGEHSLTGKMVTELVHERYSLSNGEYGRQQLQKEALVGIAKKALSPKTVTKLPELVDSISEFIVETNMSNSDIISIAYAVQNFDPDKQIQYHQLTGQGQTLYDDILKNNNSQIVINEDEMKKIVEEYYIH
ncbi:cell envelope-related transcriptional attenuator [Caldibacillus thermoamylovorans]|uniref:Cell envelope-related transcriptional attenuator n=1 Tax=Caldibacillus thermoamylovorans TaxID=35841 RepID=A0A090IZ46_9BACI|nr:LCP family protein [Caldibacillus thermoamylovorans]CEE03017.1 cell envelope-related transcriptional attenuator [Caldibacillus thermoamylovorans]